MPPPSLPPSQSPRNPPANPSIPKLPEPSSSLSGPRLLLHNNILSLLISDNIEEANSLVRHSLYSNCRPTIYTVNAVLSSFLSNSRHADLLALYRFANQAGVAPTVFTHKILIQSFIDYGKLDLAIDHYRFLCNELPLLPSPSVYRVLVRGLVRGRRMEEAMRIKEEMVATIDPPDFEVYDVLISGLVDDGDLDGAIVLYEELRGILGEGFEGFGGIVVGSVMKAFFRKGLCKEGLDLYDCLVGKDGAKFRFRVRDYNSVLDAFCGNGMFEEALSLFGRMMAEHCAPIRVFLDLESFRLMVDGHCAAGRFGEAIDVFRKIGEKRIVGDALFYNNLIGKLGGNGMVVEAEEIYGEMSEHGIKPNEITFVLLMEGCFGVGRKEDALRYLFEMADLGVEAGTLAYNTVLGGLVKMGDVTEAKVFFDRMMEKGVKRDLVSYEIMLKAFCESNRLDDVFVVVRDLLMDNNLVFLPEMKKLVEDAVRREQMEGELARLYDEVEKEKEDVIARAAEEKERADALAREERLRKRAEAKAKQAATTKITKEHIEMHIKRFSLNNVEEKQDLPHIGGIFGNIGLSK